MLVCYEYIFLIYRLTRTTWLLIMVWGEAHHAELPKFSKSRKSTTFLGDGSLLFAHVFHEPLSTRYRTVCVVIIMHLLFFCVEFWAWRNPNSRRKKNTHTPFVKAQTGAHMTGVQKCRTHL